MQDSFLREWPSASFNPWLRCARSSFSPYLGLQKLESWPRLTRACLGSRYLFWVEVQALVCSCGRRRLWRQDGIPALCSSLCWRKMTRGRCRCRAQPHRCDRTQALVEVVWLPHSSGLCPDTAAVCKTQGTAKCFSSQLPSEKVLSLPRTLCFRAVKSNPKSQLIPSDPNDPFSAWFTLGSQR